MIRIDHTMARRLIFSAYVAIAALFCLLLLHAGSKEMSRTERLSEGEGVYMEGLNQCKEAMNGLSSATAGFALDRAPDAANRCFDAATELHGKADGLAKASLGRERESSATNSLADLAAKAQALSLAARHDAQGDRPERDAMLREDAQALAETCAAAADTLQRLLREETDRIAIWRHESLRFFINLQFMVALFFIGATVFSVVASVIYGAMLKTSIRKLAEAAQALREGRLDFRLENPPRGELGRLMDDFNAMAGRIESQSQALTNANEELKEQAADLIAAHHHKDRFLANMSHELRTPLNAVMGFADLIAQRSESAGQAKNKADAERIANAAEHLLELISGLLEIARFDAGQLKPVVSEFDLAFCARELAAMLSPLAQRKGLEFRTELQDGLTVKADRRMMRQIVINLLGNALKFTDKGFVALRVSGSKDAFKIEVEDSGIGIADEEKAALFTDFHRVEKGLTSKYPGAGIGLALSRRLVELHGGRIIFESSIGKGSRFTAEIPATPKT